MVRLLFGNEFSKKLSLYLITPSSEELLISRMISSNRIVKQLLVFTLTWWVYRCFIILTTSWYTSVMFTIVNLRNSFCFAVKLKPQPEHRMSLNWLTIFSKIINSSGRICVAFVVMEHQLCLVLVQAFKSFSKINHQKSQEYTAWSIDKR